MADYQRLHAQLLDMLGAKDHVDAAGIIGTLRAHELAQEKTEPVDVEAIREVVQFLRSRRHGALWEAGVADTLDAAISTAPPAERVSADAYGMAFVDGMGWVVQCSRATEYVANLLRAKLSDAPEAKPHG